MTVSPKIRRAILAAALLLLAVAGVAAWSRAHGTQKVTVDFLDVGQGDSELIRWQDQEMLIDGGPDRSVMADLGRVLPFSDRSIEYVVLTHPHADHYTGLIGVLKRYAVRTVILPQTADRSPGYLEFLAAVRESGATVAVAHAGDRIALGPASLSVLSVGVAAQTPGVTDGANDQSSVIELTAFGGQALLMADAEAQEVSDLLDATTDLSADLLKVGHHGGRTATTAELLRRVRPADAVIEVGRNYYGHPSPTVLERLRQAGSRIWRTDRDGIVQAEFSAAGVRVGKFGWW